MRKCWEIDPSQRGSFSELVEKFLSLQRTFSICHSTQEVRKYCLEYHAHWQLEISN